MQERLAGNLEQGLEVVIEELEKRLPGVQRRYAAVRGAVERELRRFEDALDAGLDALQEGLEGGTQSSPGTPCSAPSGVPPALPPLPAHAGRHPGAGAPEGHRPQKRGCSRGPWGPRPALGRYHHRGDLGADFGAPGG